MIGGKGLVHVSTSDLKLMLSRLHRGQLSCPVTHDRLVIAGLPQLVDKVDFLKGLDEPAVRAVLVAVIAERRANEPRS
ncbi:hypothetical protein [Sandaracinus amylolyticus]|uniref:Uncharacterized protein n=1 Tax=Sandaracinus amylolyticus TaxID=927083 RepID=A0A0F6YLN9_9BACT|nr:hypothetical protein [Sandaracinus amylolyticus]AKF09685.1 hypothetical protein DB32_006834 [Sandaracinus amylolyticus]